MASQTDLLITKIKIPHARAGLVPRPRLYHLLEQGLTGKLTLISAPPGSGKTTLIIEWRTTPAGAVLPMAWLALDPGDNDPVRFWRYVIAALKTLAPTVGDESLAGLLTPQPAATEQILTALINSTLEELDSDFVLVLDDYHFIESQEIHTGVSWLLEHLPYHMHLVILSRTEPLKLPLSRLRVRRELIDIGRTDLRFSAAEAAAFFEKVLHRPLITAEVEMLEQRTEGWAAGLQLTALSLQNERDTTSFIQAFSRSQRLVLDYLADEVFYHQQPAVQEFLLATAVLGQLNAELAQAVSGKPNSFALLEQLDRANLFLTSLDTSHEWYRYHPLFAEFLVNLLKRTQPELLPQLHRRAASWYQINGFEAEALSHWLAAAEYGKVVELLFKLVLPLVHQGQSVTVMHWFEALPGEILDQNPQLNNLYATALMVANRFDEMEAPLLLAENSFQMQGNDASSLAFTRGLHAQLTLARGETAMSKRLAQSVFELAASSDPLLAALPDLTIGSALLFEGEIKQAEEYLSRASHQWVELQKRNMLAEAQLMRGNLDAAADQSRQILELDTKNNWQEGFARLRLARIYYEWNELVAARIWLSEALHHSHLQSAYLPVAYLLLARLERAEGQTELAFEALTKASDAAKRLKHHPLQARAEAWQNYFRVLGGDKNDLAGVWRWFEAHKLTNLASNELSYQQERQYLTLVQAELASNQVVAALARLEQLAEFAQSQERLTSLVEILALQALALAMTGQSEAALETLSISLKLAAPGKLTRIYLNQATPMYQLLTRLKKENPNFTPVDSLLAAFADANSRERATEQTSQVVTPPIPIELTLSPKADFVLVEPLSERELEVLRLIQEGLSNKAIADRLYLSLATIKTHINHLYAKLAVENRVQALARARTLKLI